MSPNRLIVFAGGGTGGHLFPALAIVEWLRTVPGDLRFEFFCTQRPIDQRILSSWDVPFTVQPVQPFGFTPGRAIRFYNAWRKSLALCVEHFTRDRPAVVIGTGGFGSGPPVKAAARLRVPTALFNPDAIPGRANRYLARSVNTVFSQWAQTADHFPKFTNVIATGCPVRRGFYDTRTNADYAIFGLDPSLKTLLVTGASSGARTINEALIELAPYLMQVDGWQILHISGGADEDRLRRTYAQGPIRAYVVDFTEAMPVALRIADLAVARAGAVALAELTATATPAILMPYPFHRDNHQTANAEMLVQRGAAIRLTDSIDPAKNAVQLRAALLPLMNNGTALSKMSTAALQNSNRDSTALVSQHILDLGNLVLH